MRRIGWMLALAAVAGCAAPQLGRDDRAALEAGEQRLRAGVLAADWAMLDELYADSAVLMPPAAPAVAGRSAIVSRFGTSGMQVNAYETSLHAVDGAGHIAYVRGAYLMTSAPFGSSQFRTETGKYVRVWRREGSGWRIVADIWNTDGAAGETGSAEQAEDQP